MVSLNGITLWLTCIIVLYIQSNSAFATGCGSVIVMSSTSQDGERIEIEIDSNKLGEASLWSPRENPSPNLSGGEVARIATNWGDRHFDSTKEYEIQQISLTRIGCSALPNSWYYLVEFIEKSQNNLVPRKHSWLAILLDNTVLEPTRLEKSTK